MLSYPAGYEETINTSHQIIVEADVYVAGHPIFMDLPVVDGSISIDRTANVRRSCRLTIRPDPELIPDINGTGVLSVYGNEIAIRRGVDVPGYTDPEKGDSFWRAPLGVFRIAEPALSGGDQWQFTVSGYDRSQAVADRSFLAPWKVTGNSSITDVATSVVTSRLPDIPTRIVSVTARTPAIAFDIGADPWQSIADLVGNTGLEAYFDGEGAFTIDWQPDPSSDPVWTYESAAGLISVQRNVADDKPISAVLLTSESSQETTPVRVLVVDDDPSSPTFAYGDYGIVPYTATVETTLGAEQAEARARTILRDKLGTDEKFSATILPNQALEEGDVVMLVYEPIGMEGHYVIDQMEIPLTVANPMTISGRRRVSSGLGRGIILSGPYSVTDWNSVSQATAKTTTDPISWVADDVIVVMGATWDTTTLPNVPTATGLTFSTVGSAVSGASTCYAQIWSATAAAAGSAKVSLTPNASCRFGFFVWVAGNTGGIGNNATGGTTSQTVSLVRSADNSAVLELIADYGAGSPSGHTWTPPTGYTERAATQYLTGGGADVYTIYAAEWANQSTAGTTSYGISVTGSGGNYSKLAVEVLAR